MDKNLILNKPRILEILDETLMLNDLVNIRARVARLKQNLCSPQSDEDGILNIDMNGDTIQLSQSYLLHEIQQIEETKTVERTLYYLERFKKSLAIVKTSKINDINLNRWKEYSNILTDSLWVLNRRDSTGIHSAWYWGNFVPQIPYQMLVRYTKKGEWVLDPFLGSGTTLIECQRLGRNGIGIELQPDIARKAKEIISKEDNKHRTTLGVEIGDSASIDLQSILEKYGAKSFQLLILHPPYHDIIKFSDNPNDLSNSETVTAFVNAFGRVLDNTIPLLDTGRYLAVVIGDKYSKGEWIPLGFLLMNEVLNRGFILKSTIVKNFEETAGKRNKKDLWRYRALVGGFYIFKHEYIFVFKKRGS
ncbi:MAG: DNA methyltransferase [Chloroflexi bacterium]|nr:DNA methyltransferase [Chloroflexota bacterium]